MSNKYIQPQQWKGSCAKLQRDECVKYPQLNWISGKGCRLRTYSSVATTSASASAMAPLNPASLIRQNNGSSHASDGDDHAYKHYATLVLKEWFSQFYSRQFDETKDNRLLFQVANMIRQNKSRDDIHEFISESSHGYQWKPATNINHTAPSNSYEATPLDTQSINSSDSQMDANNEAKSTRNKTTLLDTLTKRIIDKYKFKQITYNLLRERVKQVAHYYATNGDGHYRPEYESFIRMWMDMTRQDMQTSMLEICSEFSWVASAAIHNNL